MVMCWRRLAPHSQRNAGKCAVSSVHQQIVMEVQCTIQMHSLRGHDEWIKICWLSVQVRGSRVGTTPPPLTMGFRDTFSLSGSATTETTSCLWSPVPFDIVETANLVLYHIEAVDTSPPLVDLLQIVSINNGKQGRIAIALCTSARIEATPSCADGNGFLPLLLALTEIH